MSEGITTVSEAGESAFRGKRVLLRLDLNVTLSDEGTVEDDFRIQKILPTIRFFREAGARTILLSHIGRGKDDSLLPVFDYLGSKVPLSFAPDLSEATVVQSIQTLKDGDVLLLENLRRNDGEENNDIVFAERFAQFADCYVNDAFATSHRKHASIVSLPKLLPAYAGPLFESEIAHLSTVFHPPKPFLFILGGAKFETKLPLIERFIKSADTCFIGGALAHPFFLEKGYALGASLLPNARQNIAPLFASENLLLPLDVSGIDANGALFTKKPIELSTGDRILDAGPETLQVLKEKIHEARFVLWNGPIGDYLIPGFGKGTETVVHLLAERHFKDGELVVGGGDTAAVISHLRKEKEFPFISTGGGAMLEYLAMGTLPGIEALKK